MVAGEGRLMRVHLAQYDQISVAGMHAQHARERRLERMVSSRLIGAAATLCSLGLPLRLGIRARPDVPRNLLPDVVQERDLNYGIDAPEMGTMLPASLMAASTRFRQPLLSSRCPSSLCKPLARLLQSEGVFPASEPAANVLITHHASRQAQPRVKPDNGDLHLVTT
jgi:hypothetical protein